MQRTLEAGALRVFLYAKVDHIHANEAKETVQASWLSAFDWRPILRASRQTSRR